MTFELFVPARLDAIDPESRLIAAADKRAAIAALHDAVAALPPDEARVVHLHYVEQLPLRQIAEQLGVSHSTVKRLHRRARTQLRRALASRGVTSFPR